MPCDNKLMRQFCRLGGRHLTDTFMNSKADYLTHYYQFTITCVWNLPPDSVENLGAINCIIIVINYYYELCLDKFRGVRYNRAQSFLLSAFKITTAEFDVFTSQQFKHNSISS